MKEAGRELRASKRRTRRYRGYIVRGLGLEIPKADNDFNLRQYL